MVFISSVFCVIAPSVFWSPSHSFIYLSSQRGLTHLPSLPYDNLVVDGWYSMRIYLTQREHLHLFMFWLGVHSHGVSGWGSVDEKQWQITHGVLLWLTQWIRHQCFLWHAGRNTKGCAEVLRRRLETVIGSLKWKPNSLFWLSKGKHFKFFNGLCGKFSVTFRTNWRSVQ